MKRILFLGLGICCWMHLLVVPLGAQTSKGDQPETAARWQADLVYTAALFSVECHRRKKQRPKLGNPGSVSCLVFIGSVFWRAGPGLDPVLNPKERVDLIDVLWIGGDAMKFYQDRKQRYGGLSWWQPFERNQLNVEGYRLLEQGRKTEAITAFLMVVDRFPGLWEPWGSLAEAT